MVVGSRSEELARLIAELAGHCRGACKVVIVVASMARSNKMVNEYVKPGLCELA